MPELYLKELRLSRYLGLEGQKREA